MPGAYARTAAQALTSATFRYIEALAETNGLTFTEPASLLSRQ